MRLDEDWATTDVLPESPKVSPDTATGTEVEGNFDSPDLVSVLDTLRERFPSEQGRGSGSFAPEFSGSFSGESSSARQTERFADCSVKDFTSGLLGSRDHSFAGNMKDVPARAAKTFVEKDRSE